jgi:asparagine synthase (glutamine-hydrolysing)
MNEIQKHRGPDDYGIWNDSHCVLGHRRLSIIDLSSNGHQPFLSDDNRYCLTYNGEIYNYLEIREDLKKRGIPFRTNTDTEVLLKAYLAFGKDCLNRFNGMFAFAIYDSLEHSLFLARDRVGVKPLYYRLFDSGIIFSSEIKALRQAGMNRPSVTVNESALFDYLCFNRTDIEDETFIREIRRLTKGHYALFDRNGFKTVNWWNPEDYVNRGVEIPIETIRAKIRETLVSAVTLRMRSDVPVGSCLSGGLDSSILVGILYNHLNPGRTYKTFTAAFPGYRLDETHYVDALNKRYPFQNFRTYPTADNALNSLESFVFANDEPVSSPTFFSQYEVMRLAHEHGVTVLLDGQGGDENFAGYQYFHGFHFYGLYRNRQWGRLAKELWKCIYRKQTREAFETFAFQLLPGPVKKELLLRTLPHIHRDFFYDNIENSIIYSRFFSAENLNQSIVRHFQYKLEHLLRMEDRNSMAFGIEARVPYLDYRLIEYVLGVPEKMKIMQGENKVLQKQAAGDFSIPEIVNRTDKVGFGTPGEEWMETPAWKKVTSENADYVLSSFPGMFRKSMKLKNNLYDRWKINQLAVWSRQAFANK